MIFPTETIFFWDFDGVILNSNAVRDRGFIEVLKAYPEDQVELLLEFHQRNGGLSRYVKFRHFFEEIRKEPLTEEHLARLCNSFSEIMRALLADKNLLFEETVNFIRDNFQKYPMHIVSGSDQEELRYLSRQLGIDGYFQSIHGSPTPKKEWVATLIGSNQYPVQNCILIGDSINDFEAAQVNGIRFLCYNNKELAKEHNEFKP